MELFLSNTWESTLLHLLSSYLQLINRNIVKPIFLSKQALNLNAKNQLGLPSVPCIITEDEKILTTVETISVYLVNLAFLEQLLIGKDPSEEAKVLSVFEICKKKEEKDVFQVNNYIRDCLRFRIFDFFKRIITLICSTTPLLMDIIFHLQIWHFSHTVINHW